jgi:hypothetical protein
MEALQIAKKEGDVEHGGEAAGQLLAASRATSPLLEPPRETEEAAE